MFVKSGDFIKFKGLSCGNPRDQAILRKSKAPRNPPEKWTFLSLAFYNAPSLHIVEIISAAPHMLASYVEVGIPKSSPISIASASLGGGWGAGVCCQRPVGNSSRSIRRMSEPPTTTTSQKSISGLSKRCFWQTVILLG